MVAALDLVDIGNHCMFANGCFISDAAHRFGIGVAHAPSHLRMGVSVGRPLGDIRAFVAKFRSYGDIGALPPIILTFLIQRRLVSGLSFGAVKG